MNLPPSLAWLTLLVGTSSLLGAQTPIAREITNSLLAKDATQYGEFFSGDTAEVRIAKHIGYDATHNTYIVASHYQDEIHPGHEPNSVSLPELKTLVYNSDAIIIGTPFKRESSLTKSHHFVFSDYEVEVDTVYKDLLGSIAQGLPIVLSRPGGVVNVSGEQFRAIEEEFPLFHLNSEYVFFLHFNAATGSFKVNPSDVYLIENGKVLEGRKHPKVVSSTRDLNLFLSQIREAISSDTETRR